MHPACRRFSNAQHALEAYGRLELAMHARNDAGSLADVSASCCQDADSPAAYVIVLAADQTEAQAAAAILGGEETDPAVIGQGYLDALLARRREVTSRNRAGAVHRFDHPTNSVLRSDGTIGRAR